jgi:hypothetical protein
MFSSRLLCRILLVVFSLGILAGCHGAGPAPSTAPAARTNALQPPAESSRAQAPKSGDTTIVDAAPAPGTAAALAQRATSYANSVEPIFAQRPSTRPAEASDFPQHNWAGRSFEDPPARQGVTNQGLAPVGPAIAVAPKKTEPPSQPTRAKPNPAENAQRAPAISMGSDAFAAKLNKRAADYPEDLAAQTDDQIVRLLQEQSVPDMQSLARLAPEDRELLSALLDALTNFRNQLRQNSNMLFSQKIAPLVDLSDRLRSQAELSVPTFVICTDALYFGRYTKLDPARFVAMQPHKIRIYYEVENFSSILNDASKEYETKLGEQLVLYAESSGMQVWSSTRQTMHDFSHRRRRDFFVAEEISLPRALTIGRYLLKVTVEDQQARRIAENTVPIEMVAQ